MNNNSYDSTLIIDMISCLLLNIGLFIKGSEFKEILRTCTEPTSLLHEKTTRDNLRQFRTDITKVFEFKEIREFTLTPQSFPYQKLLETTPSSYWKACYKEN